MSDTVDVSAPIGASGRFLELHKQGNLDPIRRLWKDFVRAKNQLECIQKNLDLCNSTPWLFAFSTTCKRTRRDFVEELPKHIKALNDDRIKTQSDLDLLKEEIRRTEPLLFQMTENMSAVWLTPDCSMTDVTVRRNAVIRRCMSLSVLDTCRRLDLAEIPIPDRWKRDFPKVENWVQAYHNHKCRNRVQKLISNSKKFLRLPGLPSISGSG